jgi:transposase
MLPCSIPKDGARRPPVPSDEQGYRQLLSWLDRHGQVGVVGVEGTSSYGAGLAGYLLDQQVRVVEVDRPDRRTRR